MTSSLRLRTAVTALVSLCFAASCAEERPPINQVQANALDKSFFVGPKLDDQSDNPEFYYRPTIVDVDYGAGQAALFTASSQTIARIKWEITENTLNARLTYEHILDSTGNGTPTSPDANSGQIAASFKIESHFDIKRSYNPQTGEDQNIVVENTTDRPWYERQYMHVDWSQNLITNAYDLDTLAQLQAFSDGALTYEPVAYTVNDPNDPDSPVFDGQTGYFDVTNKVFATPQTVDTPFGTLPACYLSPDFFGGTGPDGDCDPTELKVRLSFRRVVDDDYEPVNWDGDRMNMFGLFTTGTLNPDRLGYDRNYGVVDDKWYRLVSRHNIWAQSHAYDGNGNPYPCYTSDLTPDGLEPTRDQEQYDSSGKLVPGIDGTDDECETAGVGSRCDRFRHQCTLPFRQRATVTIPFYYAPEGDPTLFDSSAQALGEWDKAMRHTVQVARYAECIRTGGGVAYDGAIAQCQASYPNTEDAAVAAVPSIFVLCHSPVVAGDDPACGQPGLLARVGDLRYNVLNVIQKPQSASPWGVMGDASDPITGEVVAASVNVWNAVTDIATQKAIDTMRWYLGELSNDDISSSNYVKAAVTQDQRGVGDPGLSTPLLSTDSISARLSAMDSRLNDGSPPLTPPANSAGGSLGDWAEAETREKWGNGVLGAGNTGVDTRLNALRGSPAETALITGPYVRLAGLDPSVALDATSINRASPLRGNFAQYLVDAERERQHLLAEKGSCAIEAPEPSSIGAWATLMNKKFPLAGSDPASVDARNDQWRQFIRRRLNAGVLIHEIGHSMGLRHQFTSSFDALNYHPQYWQLRTQDGTETAYCTAPASDGASCIGPRWFDPVTPAERDGLIWRWQHTSVMDYPGDLTQDTLGLGAYDKAALRMAYADVADVVDDPGARCTPSNSATPTSSCTTKGAVYRNLLDGFGGLIGPSYQTGPNTDIHYSQLNATLGLIRNCQPVSTDPPADWDATQNGNYSPEFDGHIVNGTACDPLPIDYVAYRDLVPDANGGAYTQEPPLDDGVVRVYDDLHRVRHPYMFGSDEFADIGNLPVQRHDNGADAYEVASFLITDYEDRHLFDDYRRNRSDFSIRNAFMIGLNRDNSKLMEITKGVALLNEVYQGTGVFAQLAQDDGNFKPSALAASLIFDHFARILTRPQSGAHFEDDAQSPLGENILRSKDQLLTSASQTVVLNVPDGSTGIGVDLVYGGRPLNNALDLSKGYYAVNYTLNAGSYYDKTIAMDLMTDSVDRFVSESRDDFSDGRYRNCSFATLFPDGLRRLIANALTDDYDVTGWRVSAESGGPDVTKPAALPTRPFGYRVWWPKDQPSTCWQFQGRLNCVEFPSDTDVSQGAPSSSIALDPEIGFEVQKFVAFFPMYNLPESWKLNWVDMMRIYDLGADTNPNLPSAIEWIDPLSGETYEAQSFGTEVIDGKIVQRSPGARVLEWMNVLTASAYQMGLDPGDAAGSTPHAIHYQDNTHCPAGVSTCIGQPVQKDPTFAARVTAYKGLIDFMRITAANAGFFGPTQRGVY
ncbi:MAG TPA: hypothetical protein VGM29_09770 [Polyangiaceae bacterium]|jgi:hypothetical protein